MVIGSVVQNVKDEGKTTIEPLYLCGRVISEGAKLEVLADGVPLQGEGGSMGRVLQRDRVPGGQGPRAQASPSTAEAQTCEPSNRAMGGT